MLEERGIVVAVAENGQVSVVTQRQSACGSCQSETSCGTNLLADSSKQQQTIVVNANGHHLAINDVVLLVVADSVIWQGMLLLYVGPLMALILGGVLGQVVAGELGDGGIQWSFFEFVVCTLAHTTRT